MISAIFWDNDGVLVDTERLYFRATQETLEAAGLVLDRDQYVEFFLRQGRGAWHLLEERGTGAAEIERWRRRRNDLYGELLEREACAIDGVAGTLELLHGRYVMGIVTSSRKDHFDIIHAKCNLLQYFDFVLTAADFERVKPHPDPYLLAIERSGAAPEECVAIEDSERGLQAATLAGIACIVIPTTLTAGGNFAAAARIVDRVEDVPAALRDL
jgi:HAD superfamily hydrolase (TIGR01509 family)